MTPQDFRAKWRLVDLTERSASQQHFLDLCDLVGHPTPADADPTGESFTFERGATKLGGGDGWADVWKKGGFGWEYKGRHKDLDAAYTQLKLYAEALENPPLLVVCDLDRIIVRTNFTNTPTVAYEISTESIGDQRSLEILRAVFFEPAKLRPGTTSQVVTETAAARIATIAQRLRERKVDPQAVATFLDRVVFCLFAEDVGLLPPHLFRRVVESSLKEPERCQSRMQQLFQTMATGGDFGAETIAHFNGSLFTDGEALLLWPDEIRILAEATRLDWSAVDASIFGTLFERGLDPDKRSQLGAHYTSRDDIERLIDPVVMAPLRREWADVRETVDALLETGRKVRPAGPVNAPSGAQLTKARNEGQIFIRRFMQRLARVKVLDPACGSGNFLYVTLQKLKDLEKEVIVFAMDRGYPGTFPEVGPWQLYGIEINPYARNLAQMVVWIGFLQWIRVNGLGTWGDPVLQAMSNIECRDALLNLAADEPLEAAWPEADFIVGNPPFLGGKKLRTELGDDYVDALFTVFRDRVPAEADFCCYWFEKARAAIGAGRTERAGLLATQAIRGGRNRRVLDRIKETGDIFFAESDREWILDGAAVHVSMIGFDRGADSSRSLDGASVERINPDLTGAADVTSSRRLLANIDRAFMGDTKGGAFDIPVERACEMLLAPNPHGRPNSDVIVPWINGLDVTRRRRDMFIIDFGVAREMSEAAKFQEPFQYLSDSVKAGRQSNRRAAYREAWWIHVEARPGMRRALASRKRFLATARVAKHRLFVWVHHPVLPDSQVIVVAASEDVDLGVLQSQIHRLWALERGTQVRERESGARYTPTTCFETFPFPDATEAQRRAIGDAARELDTLRTRWLNPPEWVVEDVLEFPASVDGPWARQVEHPNAEGIGTAKYVRLLARDEEIEKQLRKRTLTNLYNERPAWLDQAHRVLDEAVFAAYGWSPDLSAEALLEKLLELNLGRPAAGGPVAHEGEDDD
ncbi:MAG: N-6 DNA methylase [Vicinamibacterales bacterium]|nr:N-6 DNA methylase [Vicinamibacterales bacterium]